MDRLLKKRLNAWRQHPDRMPLLIRGARQVGKSYLVETFGKEHFEQVISLNFETQPHLKAVFNSFNPKQICNAITLFLRKDIVPGTTLLFLDEIQECPHAIQALRYFKEEMPELHVIGAGSLLEFTLNEADFRMPVGRIQFYFLKPLSFQEFLLATENEKLESYLREVTITEAIEVGIHEHLLNLVHQYIVLGGMPAVVQRYLKTQSYAECQELQSNLLLTYRNDFGKYAGKAQHKYLQAIFEQAPQLVCERFKYVDIDPHMEARDLKRALEALSNAGIIQQVFVSTASGLPLNATINKKKFKLLFLDVGLVQYTTHLRGELLTSKSLLAINRGRIMEQYVGQELLGLSEPYKPGEIYYWEREKLKSSAEVDYVISVDSDIIPIEVKSGTTGQLKSLHVFMKEKASKIGVRISQQSLTFSGGILSIPLYMVHELPRLIRVILKSDR